MKYFYAALLKPFIFLLLSGTFFIGKLCAQETVFGQTLRETELPASYLLKKDIASHYAVTRYAWQPDFFGPKDLRIVLTPDLALQCRYVKMITYPTGSSSYVGKIYGNAEGDVSFSKYADRISGMIQLTDGRKYLIDQTAPDIFAVSVTREEAYINKETLSDFVEPVIKHQGQVPGNVVSICDSTATCGGSSVIDIMVVYTPDAETKWGGNANTVANITQAVSNMNVSMSNSGVNNVTFRLVHTAKVNYVESGSFSTDLSRLGSTNDGYLDSVHILRDLYGADLVSMIIGTPTSSCGIGYINTGSTTYSSSAAFNVTLYSCAVGNYTMSHECGHNMGLRHDYYVDAGTTPCSHHHGYVNQTAINLGASSTSAQRWRTIMAYNDQCAATGFTCSRLNRWSNPNIIYNGDRTGAFIGSAQPADETFAFYRMACFVAGFRTAVSSCPVPSGLNATNLTFSSADVGWNTVTGAMSYDVDYRLSGAASWTNAASGTVNNSIAIGGLSQGVTYEWRVRTNCTGESSAYSQSQFTTLVACGTPASLTASSVTSSSAVLNWGAVSNALGYDVDYRASSSLIWIPAGTGLTSLNIAVSGLAPATAYSWRVRATCSDGIGNYASSSFTSGSLSCVSAYETNESRTAAKDIPVNTVISAAISSATDNDYYRIVTTGTSGFNITLSNLPANYQLYLYSSGGSVLARSENTGTAGEAIIYNNAPPSTYYVRIFGLNGVFSTSACYDLFVGNILPPPCVSNYDTSANNVIAGASLIPFNSDIKGLISPLGDVDYYRINLTVAASLTITLTTLPANYDLRLYNALGTTSLKSSNKSGSTNETITYSALPGTYYVRVIGSNNAYNSTMCYTLRVANPNAPDAAYVNDRSVFSPGSNPAVATMKSFPVPVRDKVHIIYTSPSGDRVNLEIRDVSGRLIRTRTVNWNKGFNNLTLDMSDLHPGVYFIRSSGREAVLTNKVVKQ